MRRGVLRSLSAVGLSLLAVLHPGCTTFDGLRAHPNGEGYLSLADATHVCGILFSCSGASTTFLGSTLIPADVESFSVCLDWLSTPPPTASTELNETDRAIRSKALACLVEAQTCMGEAPTAESCLTLLCANPTQCGPRCKLVASGKSCGSNNHLIVCSVTIQADFDCASLGGACESKGESARCTIPDEECSPYDAGIDTCVDADELSVCVDGKEQTVSCKAAGMSCKKSPGGAVGCVL